MNSRRKARREHRQVGRRSKLGRKKSTSQPMPWEPLSSVAEAEFSEVTGYGRRMPSTACTLTLTRRLRF